MNQTEEALSSWSLQGSRGHRQAVPPCTRKKLASGRGRIQGEGRDVSGSDGQGSLLWKNYEFKAETCRIRVSGSDDLWERVQREQRLRRAGGRSLLAALGSWQWAAEGPFRDKKTGVAYEVRWERKVGLCKVWILKEFELLKKLNWTPEVLHCSGNHKSVLSRERHGPADPRSQSPHPRSGVECRPT